MTEHKRSLLHDLEAEDGAVFEQYAGREVPAHFGDPKSEYDAVVDSAGVLDVSYLVKLRLGGRYRVRFLNNMLSNDVNALRPGQGCYATLLTHQGRMESDVYVFAAEQEIWLEAPPAAGQRLEETLRRFIVSEDVTIENWSDTLAVLSLQGPGSGAVADRTAGAPVSGLGPLEHRPLGEGEGSRVIRRDRTGHSGLDFWLPAPRAEALWKRWVREEGIRPAGHQALNLLRTEAGIPWFGVDMDDRRLPMEMGLTASTISFKKGCYRGQEIVARVTHRGHLDRGFGAVAFDTQEPPKAGTEVLSSGTRIGEITSAVVSPALGCALALAVLKSDSLRPGTEVEVAQDDRRITGRVVALPITPRKH